MKTRIVSMVSIAALFMSLSFFVGCSSEEEVKPEMPNTAAHVKQEAQKTAVAPTEFKAPQNAAATISAEKAKQYVNASEALVLLGAEWSEKIEKASDQNKIEILNAYAAARDEACKRIGLSGFAEYNWIDSVAVKNPVNAKVFETAGVKVSQ